MARQHRVTEPIHTLYGVLTDYKQIQRHLDEGEAAGREWIFTRAHDPMFRGVTPTEYDILALHHAMFGTLFDWAGTTRTIDCGPGGNISMPWYAVRAALRDFVLDLSAWVAPLVGTNPSAETLGAILADAHFRFEWIHPFNDTNGRTGRAFDHYLLWVTFGLVGDDLATSRSLRYFPSENHEDAYYRGLQHCDVGDHEHLRAYYAERIAVSLGKP